jgi:hypothetical protein
MYEYQAWEDEKYIQHFYLKTLVDVERDGRIILKYTYTAKWDVTV